MVKVIENTPSHLFEVSWEVCNKVGGIHTVIATKSLNANKLFGDNYIVIGPDVHREGDNYEFTEDKNLLKEWRKEVYNCGIRIKVGRWNINGSPIAVLVDFSSLFSHKDQVLKFLWENYQVDSISGEWDYIEPVLFGCAAAKVIEHYIDYNNLRSAQNIVAHFHEWMTSSGGLYLRKKVPNVATIFTTHATVMGRSLAGNGYPLYGNLEKFNADEYAAQFRVMAKHSLEKSAAANCDGFTTVSDITARESKYLLGKEVDMVTPNGFEDDFVWKGKEMERVRAESRALMINVAEACLGYKFKKEPLIVGTSGRYEFKNKGIDLFIEALKRVESENKTDREIIAYITVPAGNNGPRKDLAAHLADPTQPIDENQYKFTTHTLSAIEWDPAVKAMHNSEILSPQSNVKVIFVPSYLNGDDGIFNKTYYELLAGMDISVFASYYEPWGYTPLESVAFSVPTITTTLAGFGLWVDQHMVVHKGVEVIDRTDTNNDEVVAQIAAAIEEYAQMGADEFEKCRENAQHISKIALWDNLYDYYSTIYSDAIGRAANRTNKFIFDNGGANTEQVNFVRQQLSTNQPTWTRVMVDNTLPESLQPLDIISHNLWWSWTLGAHELFASIDEQMWKACERNPIALIGKLSYDKIKELENDASFIDKMNAVYDEYKSYMAEKNDQKAPNIAYFSMEYGLHSSLKIYSGGLGILAGDYLKEASDKNVPMVAVGLLYRYGYFTQKLSAQGAQEASYEAQNFYNLPISPMRDENGNWYQVSIAFPGRKVTARIWKCQVGRTDLYLLDTDHDLNLDEDRSITYHLYGGDWENRLKQEMVLGVGGIRALRTLGIEQDVYHCNEGHAAFIGIERIRNYVNESKLSFSEALEIVRSSSLFTTHTPVPAGHDAFPEDMLRQYMSHYPNVLGITWEQFINLGKVNPQDHNEKFSMSYLACNLSQEVNGVSWLHGEVSKDILGSLWPGYFKDELHIGYVTNGVHFPTWTSQSLRKLYLQHFAQGFVNHNYDISEWQKVHNIDNKTLWEHRMKLKENLMQNIAKRVLDPEEYTFGSPSNMVRIAEGLRPEVLTIGFARRFATYKRANLLFTNLARLEQIVNNPKQPVQFVFAGKAHPNDIPGQDLIKRIVEVSQMPQFLGKIIFLPNYDMDIARRMVQGVDVWLNTPTRPLEASGTSGEKCVMNGVLQFSVLDGWYVEGYKEGAGWMLPMERTYEDQNYQNELDAEMVYSIIEDQIAPLYYSRNEDNMPIEWLESVKRCIADIAANFTMNRMVQDYEDRFYSKLYVRHQLMVADDCLMAREIAAWKRRVSAAWDNIRIINVHQMDIAKEAVSVNKEYTIDVTVDIDGLKSSDIGVELVMAQAIQDGEVKVLECTDMVVVSQEGSVVKYQVRFNPKETGSFDHAIRVYPKNEKLPHRMDFALVKWA